MNEQKHYRFHLPITSKKWTCPNCGRRMFKPYVDDNEEPADIEKYGVCDRKDKCQYNEYPPATDDWQRELWTPRERKPLPPPKPTYYVDQQLVRDSLTDYEHNHFVTWLRALVGEEPAMQAVARYGVGTSRGWYDGGTIFWQIDGHGRTHAGKLMLYKPEDGHRVKNSHGNGVQNWVHTKYQQIDFGAADCPFVLRQCFFGEHLLAREKQKPVAIVESEKTAILASVHIPQYIWLATGGCGGLKSRRTAGGLACLKGRNVVLFPDAGKFLEWDAEADQMRPYCASVDVNTYAETKCTPEQYADGWDLADFIAAGQMAFDTLPLLRTTQYEPQPDEPIPRTYQPTSADWMPYVCFVDSSNTAYIPIDRHCDTFAVRSVEDYNKRSKPPVFLPTERIRWDKPLRRLTINKETFTISI